MASKRKSKAGDDGRTRGAGFGDYKFVVHNMEKEEKDRFHALNPTANDLEDFIGRWAETMKISISWDNYNHTFTASMTNLAEGSSDYHYILTARAPDPVEALHLLRFKHEVLLGADWGAFHARDEEDRTFG